MMHTSDKKASIDIITGARDLQNAPAPAPSASQPVADLVFTLSAHKVRLVACSEAFRDDYLAQARRVQYQLWRVCLRVTTSAP